METLVKKEKAEISTENLELAKQRMLEFISSKKLVLNGEISTDIPKFESGCKKKAFRNALSRVLYHPTMRNCNLYLHLHHKNSGKAAAKIDYSPKEKAIQAARKEWKAAQKLEQEARLKYKTEKGDFYKSK